MLPLHECMLLFTAFWAFLQLHGISEAKSQFPAPQCQSPLSSSPVPPPKFHVPGSLFPYSWFPALIGLFLLFSTISPIFLVQLSPTFNPSSFQPQFPTPAPRPALLQWAQVPSLLQVPSSSLSLQAALVHLFMPTPQIKTRSFPLHHMGSRRSLTQSTSPWLYLETPRRALPETSRSVPAAIDRPEHKSSQSDTSKRSAATLKASARSVHTVIFQGFII